MLRGMAPYMRSRLAPGAELVGCGDGFVIGWCGNNFWHKTVEILGDGWKIGKALVLWEMMEMLEG